MKRKILFSIVSAVALLGTLLGPVADAEAGRCHRRARCGRGHRAQSCATTSCSPCATNGCSTGDCEMAPEAAPNPPAAPAAPAAAPAPPAPAPAA
jgi:hypothetical protein